MTTKISYNEKGKITKIIRNDKNIIPKNKKRSEKIKDKIEIEDIIIR